MPTIQICNLNKRYEQTEVLKDVSLSLGHAERWALLGRSGVGKTTLLRILCGLEPADSGQLFIDGRDVTAQPPHLRQSALVTQDYPLYPHLTVEQNLKAAVQSCRLKPAEAQARIDEALTWFQLGELSHRLPSQLSGGQAQRIALARALIRRPALLLLDEPLSQVDGLRRAEIREFILASAQQYQTNLIVVTHDPQDALLMADHIAILDQHTLIQQGKSLEVYRRPVSRMAAELLSPFGINWLPLANIKPEAFVHSPALPTDKSLLGIRVEQVRILGESWDANASLEWGTNGQESEGMLVFDAHIQDIRHCGFATLGTAMLTQHPATSDTQRTAEESNGNKLQILDWTNRLRPGSVRLAAPWNECVWL